MSSAAGADSMAQTEPRPPESGRLLANMVLFARLLRVGELKVTPTQVSSWVEALDHVELGSKHQVKDAARAVLVSDSSELAWFDAAFELFWQRRDAEELNELELGLLVQRQDRTELQLAEPGDKGSGESAREPVITWSDQERLRDKPFTALNHQERRAVEELIARLQFEPPPVTSRRKRLRRSGREIDLRSALRRNLKNGAELIELPRLHKRLRPRPVIALCDVSGSMEAYSRLLLHFVYALSHRQKSRSRVESFAFGTRLTRLSNDLRIRQIDAALRAAIERIGDWGGGTRTGEALRTFHRHWAPRVLGRGAIVLIISDGWDRGDPRLLGKELARLQRTCDQLIWLNPLLGSADYEPLTRGMQAALPHLDRFLPVHNLRSLEQLAVLLDEADLSRRS